MATKEYEGGGRGKSRKRPLRRVPSTPYDRPPLAARGIPGHPPETEAGGSRWFSKVVDPASRVIVRSSSRLLSVFGKGFAAPPGEHINTPEEVSEVKSSPEIRGHDENPVDVRLSIHNDGNDRSEQELISCNDSFLELEKILKQKRFSRAEIDHLAELLHSRTIEPSTLASIDYKNKGKINEDSSINSSSSQQAVNHEENEKTNTSELEGQMEQLINLHGNVTYGVHVNISEESFGSPIDIARAYMGSKPRKTAPSSFGLQSQIYQRDKTSPLNLQFGNKSSNATIASRSALCFPIIPVDSGNNRMTQKQRGRSTLYKLSRSPYCRSFMMTNPTEYSPFKDSNIEPTRSLERTPSLSNIRHSGHGQALKRDSSDRDAGCFGDARRVRQKSCLKDSKLSTHADTSLTFFLGQEYKHDNDLKGPDNLDGRIPATSVLHVPPHSTEMARKILHQLDKLIPSPQNKSFEKKIIVGDASFSKSSISVSHEGSQIIKANNNSTTLLDDRGSRILEDPISSNLSRLTSSGSSNKDKAEGEASRIPFISGAEVVSCLGMNSCVTSASITNHEMKSMDSNSHGFALISMRKEPTVQRVPDAKVEPTKAERAILASVKEPREESFEHSVEDVPTSGLMHTDSDTKASDKVYTLADGATLKKEDSVSLLNFGSKVSTCNATKSISTGISARLNAVSLSAASSSTGNGAPKFQFGSGNSTNYSFTGVSALSSSTVVGVCSPVFSSLSPHKGSGSLSTSAVFPISANGVFGVSTSSTSGGSSLQFASSTSQNTARNFGAVAASSCGTHGISSGNGVINSSHKFVYQFGALDSQATSGLGSSLQASCCSRISFAISGVKPFTSASCFASSSSASLTSSSNSTLSPAVPASFSTSCSPFLLSSSLSATLCSTPLSPPSTRIAFGMSANASGSMPFVSSSRSMLPLASIGTTTSATSLSPAQSVFGLTTSTMGFRSGSSSNVQMTVQDIRTGSNLQAAPMAPTLGQPTNIQPVPSRAQVFQFGTYQNNSAPEDSSPFQAFANPGFSAGGSFSLNSGGGESSEQKFIS